MGVVNLTTERRRRRRGRARTELQAATAAVSRLIDQTDGQLFLDAEPVHDVLVHVHDMLLAAQAGQRQELSR